MSDNKFRKYIKCAVFNYMIKTRNKRDIYLSTEKISNIVENMDIVPMRRKYYCFAGNEIYEVDFKNTVDRKIHPIINWYRKDSEYEQKQNLYEKIYELLGKYNFFVSANKTLLKEKENYRKFNSNEKTEEFFKFNDDVLISQTKLFENFADDLESLLEA